MRPLKVCVDTALYSYELAEPNRGTYSPTTGHVAPTAKAALAIMAGREMDFRHDVVTSDP